jgi:hypothetical protein
MINLISIRKSDYDAIEIFSSKQNFIFKALEFFGCPTRSAILQRIELIGQARESFKKSHSSSNPNSYSKFDVHSWLSDSYGQEIVCIFWSTKPFYPAKEKAHHWLCTFSPGG